MTDWQEQIKGDPLPWLLERDPENPGVRLMALRELLARVQSRDIVVHEVETPSASPFARSLVFAYIAAYIYEQDTPIAERKAQALTLDRNLLRDETDERPVGTRPVRAEHEQGARRQMQRPEDARDRDRSTAACVRSRIGAPAVCDHGSSFCIVFFCQRTLP